MRETWFCRCRDKNGNTILRPASMDRCPVCKETAPWKSEEERRY